MCFIAVGLIFGGICGLGGGSHSGDGGLGGKFNL